MTIKDVLLSTDERSPVYLIQFQQGPIFYRYTTSSYEDPSFSGATYYRTLCSLSKLSQSVSEGPGGEGTILLATDDPVVKIFDALLPVEPVTCIVKKYENNDPDRELITVLSGEVANLSDKDDGTTELSVKPAYQSFNRSVPWQVQQETCVLALYGVQCGVNAASYRVTSTTILSLTGEAIQSSAWDTADPTYFKSGFVKCTRTREIRFILDQQANGNLVLSYPFSAATADDVFDAFAGCMRTGDICKTKFNNKINLMAFEKIPTKNMFKTGIK